MIGQPVLYGTTNNYHIGQPSVMWNHPIGQPHWDEEGTELVYPYQYIGQLVQASFWPSGSQWLQFVRWPALGGWIDMGNCQLGWPVPDGLSHRRG